MIQLDEEVQIALQKSWRSDLAHASMQRWLSICEQNHWEYCTKSLILLAAVFGASWYFTRFIFFRGQKIAHCFDTPITLDFDTTSLHQEMLEKCLEKNPEEYLETLRIIKNEMMLSILVAQFSNDLQQKDIERALTNLADATLLCIIDILLLGEDALKDDIAVLAMGRMAGLEMNFGSDMDLIFLYSDESNTSSTARTTLIHLLMRHIALASPAGILYEIDMRLRPHGSCGILVISEESFIDYHKGEREIWERQMMTRCRSVSHQHHADTTLDKIMPEVYRNFNDHYLAKEIITMRKLVEQELGNPREKFDLKHGPGGIMDIDFLCHYLQLLYGSKKMAVRTTSTRQALRELEKNQLIDKATTDELLRAYDFMKRIESCIRVFDMKPISIFPKDEENISSLASAMGYSDNESAKEFLHDYKCITTRVRKIFSDVLGVSE